MYNIKVIYLIHISGLNSLGGYLSQIYPLSRQQTFQDVSQIFIQTLDYPGAYENFTDATCEVQLPVDVRARLDIMDLSFEPSLTYSPYCLQIQNINDGLRCAQKGAIFDTINISETPNSRQTVNIYIKQSGAQPGLKTRFWIMFSGKYIIDTIGVQQENCLHSVFIQILDHF